MGLSSHLVYIYHVLGDVLVLKFVTLESGDLNCTDETAAPFLVCKNKMNGERKSTLYEN